MGLPGLPPGQYYPSAQEFYLDFPVSPWSLDSQQGSPVSCYAQTCAVQPCEQTHPRESIGQEGSQGLVTDGPVQAVRLLLAAPANCCLPASRCFYSPCSGPWGLPQPESFPSTTVAGQVNKGVPQGETCWSALPPDPRETPAPRGVTHSHCLQELHSPGKTLPHPRHFCIGKHHNHKHRGTFPVSSCR